ncbi:MAG: exodeoxyribonuclease III [Deltaproteobacteria bacterium]|nr:exodeoxyribonuclease III [Deltaproteobacteria bacterium]
MKKFISWNVNGIRAVEKKGLAAMIAGSGADIYALQETKAQPDQLTDELKNITGYTSFFASAVRRGYSGVAVYVKENPISVTTGLQEPDFDNEGRVLTLEYDDFFFVNCYFPNAQDKLTRIDYKIAFNERLLAHVSELAAKKTVVVTGDFNVAHKPIDLANPRQNEGNPGYSPRERAWMDRFISSGWVDTFRLFDDRPGQYTWWSYRFKAREKNIGWRIDYFCVDGKSRSRVKSASILSDVMGSDHCPVSVEIE